METKEIPAVAWERFCQQLEEVRPRPRLTIERTQIDGQRTNVGSELELQEARFNHGDGCNDVINFTLADGNGERTEYAVTEPIHIKLRQYESDRYNTIQIVAEDGTHTITARPGFRQDLIVGLLG